MKKTSFEREVDENLKEMDYVGGKMLWRIVIIIVIFSALSGVIWVVSKRTSVEVERKTFKESTAYNEGAAQFLTKSYREYNQTDDPAEKQAVCEYVALRYPNLNTEHIEDKTLRDFYILCISGGPSASGGSGGN
ncbi:MAG: hypothetical protein K6D97_00910 [Clostridia bacterium]|nr:hypothetical protein [Clostridia bacterium]